MNSVDLITMIGNVSRSFASLEKLFGTVAYLLGIIFVVHALLKFRQIAGSTVSSHSGVKLFVPIAYLVGGAALVFLPSSMAIMANTTFGAGNILQYTAYNPYDIKNSMQTIIRIVGALWFIRGCLLLVHASEPGVQHGSKGLVFLCAGVLAMNFQNTVNMLGSVLDQLMNVTLTIKQSQGY
ncbi:MAG: type IV secretion protein IcmC [Legionella sp.]|nr:type IV secretion protein IcmC [Legionella sp.]